MFGKEIKNLVIKSIKENKKLIKEINYDAEFWDVEFKQFRTISVNLGREKGHSTAGVELVKYFTKSKQRVLVIGPNRKEDSKYKNITTNLFKYLQMYEDTTMQLESCLKFLVKLRGLDFDIIIIDATLFLDVEFIEEYVMRKSVKWLIKLG